MSRFPATVTIADLSGFASSLKNDKQLKLRLGETVFQSRFGLYTNKCKQLAQPWE